MIAAIDLDQLAQARTPVPRLVNLGRALLARNPQAGFGHQVPHGFGRERQPVRFSEFLARERRTKIGIAFADDGQGMVGQSCRQLMITGLLALARNQTRGAFASIPARPPVPLTPAGYASLCRTTTRQLSH